MAWTYRGRMVEAAFPTSGFRELATKYGEAPWESVRCGGADCGDWDIVERI